MQLTTLFVTLFSPFLAVFAQNEINKIQEKRKRKDGIFKALMSTRQARTSQLHVEALNLIPVEFKSNSKSDKEIINRWKSYINHLNTKENLTVNNDGAQR